jgi:hypothetical protein
MGFFIFFKNKLFLSLIAILILSGCGRFAFNPFDYQSGQGAKLKVINKNKKDSGYYFTTRGPRMVLKKKLQMRWDEYFYNAVTDEFKIKNKTQKPFVFY